MATLYNPFLPDVRNDPYALYRELRETDPVQFNPHARMWAVSRHADCVSVLRDRRFSSRLAHRMRRRRDALPASMLTTDPPEHTRLRAPYSRLFGRAAAESAGERARATAERLLGELAYAAAPDLMSGFARPLVTATFVELLGLPAEGADRLGRLVHEASGSLDPLADPARQSAASRASEALTSSFRTAIAARRRAPGDDLLSGLVAAADGSGASPAGLLTTCKLVLIGGHDPAVHLIGNGLRTLLARPAEWERLRRDPALVPSAVEEVLRFESPIQLAARVAAEDAEVAGARIRRGQAVLVLLGAANRDPAVFADPEDVDVARAPNPHLAFGGGAHLCLGAPLARAIGRAALEAVLAVWPDVRLAGRGPRWSETLVPRGLRSLPIEPG